MWLSAVSAGRAEMWPVTDVLPGKLIDAYVNALWQNFFG